MTAALGVDQLAALRDLRRVFSADVVALVGAAALSHWLPVSIKTEDIDLVVAAPHEPDTLARDLRWKRHPRKEHEWTTPQGVKVDVLPVDAASLAARRLEWPESKMVMNLTGTRLVFQKGTLVKLAEDAEVLVPPVPVIAILKMVAYLDRHAGTSKDLVHLNTIFDEYPGDDDDRLFTHEQAEAGLLPPVARVDVLARELGALVDRYERAECLRFVRLMSAEPRHAAAFARVMTQSGEERESLLAERLERIQRALSAP